MNVAEEVRSRRWTAVLEEALGNGVPPDLEERVLLRVQSAAAAKVRPFPALAAVTLLAGVLVVWLVAWSRSSRGAATPLQDPQKADAPVVIDLTAPPSGDAAKAIDVPPGDAAARVIAIARGAGIDLVVGGALVGESRVALKGLTSREAIEAIAAERRVGLAEHGATLVLGVGRPPEPRGRATFGTDVVGTVDALKLLHARSGVNLVVATERAVGRFRIDVRDRPWRTVLDGVAAGMNVRVVGRGNVLALARDEAGGSAGTVPSFVLQGDGPFRSTVESWVGLANVRVFVHEKVEGTVRGFVSPGAGVARERIAALAEAVRADVSEDDGLFRVEPRLANDTGITLTAEGMSLRELVELSSMTQQPNVELAEGVDAKVTVLVANALWFDVLRAAAVAAGRQFVRTKNGYRIE